MPTSAHAPRPPAPLSSTPAPSGKWRQAWIIGVLGVLTAFAPMSIDMYLPAFGRIGADLHASQGAVQLSLVVFFAGLALGQLFWGPMSDRRGRKAPLLAGITLYGLASAGCMSAASIDALIAWRALQGLSGCAGIVLARSMVRDSFAPQQVARVFSRLTLVLGVAPILAPLAGGWLVQHAGWRQVFGALLVFGVVCLAAALTLPETLPAARRHQQPRAVHAALGVYASLLRDRDYLRAALVAALTQSCMFAYILASPAVFMGQFGVAPEHFGYFFGANAAGLIGASQVNHALLPRVGLERMLRAGVTLLAVSSVCLLVAAVTGVGGLWTLVPPLFASVASLGLCGPNILARALASQGERAGSAAAMLGSLQFWVAAAAGTLVASQPGRPAVGMAVVLAACAWAAWILHRAAARQT